MSYTQENRAMQIFTPLEENVLLLTGLRGAEGISRPFRFDLDLISDAPDIEFDQIVAFDQFRRQRARHEEALRVVGMAHADMAVGVDYVFIGENAVGDDKIAHQVFELAHGESIGSTVATTLGRSTVTGGARGDGNQVGYCRLGH